MYSGNSVFDSAIFPEKKKKTLRECNELSQETYET